MLYNRINWKNLPDETTPLTAENMNKMDEGIWNIENSAEIGKTIINNGGIYTDSSTKFTGENRQVFTIGPNIDGNYGRYCTCEYRAQAGTGVGILNNSKTNFYIVDIFDMGNKIHGQIVGQFAPNANPINRIMGIYGNILNFGTIVSNEVGTVEFSYTNQSMQNSYVPMFKAELWSLAP